MNRRRICRSYLTWRTPLLSPTFTWRRVDIRPQVKVSRTSTFSGHSSCSREYCCLSWTSVLSRRTVESSSTTTFPPRQSNVRFSSFASLLPYLSLCCAFWYAVIRPRWITWFSFTSAVRSTSGRMPICSPGLSGTPTFAWMSSTAIRRQRWTTKRRGRSATKALRGTSTATFFYRISRMLRPLCPKYSPNSFHDGLKPRWSYSFFCFVLLQEFSDGAVMSFDPLPPVDSVSSYNRPNRPGVGATAASQLEGGLLGSFLRSLMPSFNPDEVVANNQQPAAGQRQVDDYDDLAAAGEGAAADLLRSGTHLMTAMRDLISSIHLPALGFQQDASDEEDDHSD